MDGSTIMGTNCQRCARLFGVGHIIRGYLAAGGDFSVAVRLAYTCGGTLGPFNSSVGEVGGGRAGGVYDTFGSDAVESLLGCVGQQQAKGRGIASGCSEDFGGDAREVVDGSELNSGTDERDTSRGAQGGVDACAMDNGNVAESKTTGGFGSTWCQRCEVSASRALLSTSYITTTNLPSSNIQSVGQCDDVVGVGKCEDTSGGSERQIGGTIDRAGLVGPVFGPNGGISMGRGPKYARNLANRTRNKERKKVQSQNEVTMDITQAKKTLDDVWVSRNILEKLKLDEEIDAKKRGVKDLSSATLLRKRADELEQELRIATAKFKIKNLEERANKPVVENRCQTVVTGSTSDSSSGSARTVPSTFLGKVKSERDVSVNSSVSQRKQNGLAYVDELRKDLQSVIAERDRLLALNPDGGNYKELYSRASNELYHLRQAMKRQNSGLR